MQVLDPAKDVPCSPCNCLRRQQLLISNCRGYSGPTADRRHLWHANRHCACPAVSMCSDSGGNGMAPAWETATHRFEEGDRIGKGGSCDVYCGVEKGTGKRHALKVLREGFPAQQSQLLQEANVLVKLSCSNIVRMYGLSYELETGRPVMVLEYCNGGSLLSFLSEPENARGLEDDDYLTLLRNSVDALTYLQGAGIVHRDIKPGNILRHVHYDGKCEFKLSDFGTSREVADTKQMDSIVGTEEYLHPVLYKTAFFGNRSLSTITPTSGELWSLGCTLYHAMTASLPFRPLGGSRNNRKAMLVIISQKPPGSISGHQRMDGTFRWESAPPGDCRMSESLRQKVTPLLQNLLESDASRQWSFATFLDESQRLLDMRSFHVCDTECGHQFRLYMGPKQSVAELQDSLAYHTEVPAGQQLLFHRVQPLLTLLGPTAHVAHLPATQHDQPLLLLSPRRTTEGRCRRQVAIQPQLLVAESTLEEDVTSAFKACSDLYTHLLMATTMCRLPALLFSAILALRNTLASCQSTVESRFRVLSATCQERQGRMALISQMAETLHPPSSSSMSPSSSSSSSSSPSSSSGQHSRLNEARDLCDQLRDRLWQLKYRLDEFRRGAADGQPPDSFLFEALGQEDSYRCQTHLYQSARELWQQMRDRRLKVPLDQLEQDKHKGDRNSLNTLCLQSTKTMKALCAHRDTLLERYRALVRQLHKRLDAAQDIDDQLQKLKEDSEQFSALLDQVWRTECQQLTKMAEHSRRSSPGPRSSPLSSQLNQLMAEGLPVLETFHLTQAETRRN